MTNTDRATERPWTVVPEEANQNGFRWVNIVAENGRYVVGSEGIGGPQGEIDAALIVHSVNSLPVALKALEEAREMIEGAKVAINEAHKQGGFEWQRQDKLADKCSTRVEKWRRMAEDQITKINSALATIKDSANG